MQGENTITGIENAQGTASPCTSGTAAPCAFSGSVVPMILTLLEAAAFLRISRSTMKRLALEGTVPGRRVGSHGGRQWRFHRRVLEDFVARGERRHGEGSHA